MIEKCSITKLLLLFRGDENGLMQYRTAGSVLPLLPPARVADRHSCKYIFLDDLTLVCVTAPPRAVGNAVRRLVASGVLDVRFAGR